MKMKLLLVVASILASGTFASANEASPTGQVIRSYVKTTVSLPCLLTQTEFNLVQWTRNDSGDAVLIQYGDNYRVNVDPRYKNRVSLVNRKDLQIRDLRTGDEDAYFCTLSLSKGQGPVRNFDTRNSPVHLMVLDQSKFQVPAAQKLARLGKEAPRCLGATQLFIAESVGSTVWIPCNVIGNPPPKIVWTHNDKVVKQGRFTVTTKGLTIKYLKSEDSGTYMLTLSSEAGTYHHTTQLIVKTSSSVLPGHYIDAVENQMKTIPCGSDAVDSNAKITWMRNGVEATKNPRFTLDTATGALVVNRADRNDSGSYNCSIMKIVKGRFTVVGYEMYFNVQYQPDIIYHYPEETALIGQDIFLPCVAVGNPAANVSWQYNGKDVAGNPRYEVERNGSLILEKVTLKDAGVYACTPFNRWKGQTKHTKLEVLVPPAFKTRPNPVLMIPPGANVSFDCSASGIPKPNVTWPPVWSPWPEKRMTTTKNGVRTIFNMQLSDAGRYRCVVVSTAGFAVRDFLLYMKARPYKPINVTTESYGFITKLSWGPKDVGIIVDQFELWYRPVTASDYDWHQHKFTQYGNETANLTGIMVGNDYIIRLRGNNSQGLGPFSDAFFKFKNGSGGRVIRDIIKEETPLAPYNVQVKKTKDGYFFGWKSVFAPGRPEPKYFILESRLENGTWKPTKIDPNARSFLFPLSGVKDGNYSFRMYADGVFASTMVEPKVWASGGSTGGGKEVPTGPGKKGTPGEKELPTSPAASERRKKKKETAWPAIILGILLGVFVLILFISLLCFLRATGRLRRYRVQRTQDRALLDDKLDGNGFSSDGNDTLVAGNGIKVGGDKAFFKKQARKSNPFHFDNCPIKLISEYDEHEYEKLINQASAHVIFSESPEKCQCEYRRCMTLPRKPGTKPQKAGKPNLFKSSSLPNGMTSANGTLSHEITDETMLDDDDYDSEDDDFVDSKFPTIDRKFSKMKNAKMIDSYDQFCRSPSDFGSKDIVSLPKNKHPRGNDVDFYVSPHEEEAKMRLITPTEMEPNADGAPVSPTESSRDEQLDRKENEKEIHSGSGSPDQGSKENVFDDPNDASSENSVAESDRRVFAVTAPSKIRHPSAKPGYVTRSLSLDEASGENPMSVDRSLSAIKEISPRNSSDSVEKHSLRSLELRSSGFESEGKPPSTSDTESVLNSVPPQTSAYKFKDIDVMSDISTRSSPGPLRRAMPNGRFDEHYEWDIPKRRTYGRPIFDSAKKERYEQHRYSQDNEDLFRSIVRMQKQLGVELEDSWDNLSEDTNLSLLCSSQTPFYRDGYASDVPSSFTDKINSYSEREKNRRCEELLKELKRNKSTSSTLPRTTRPVKRTQSAVSDYTRSQPMMPPFMRSNSACEEETTVYHEWLV